MNETTGYNPHTLCWCGTPRGAHGMAHPFKPPMPGTYPVTPPPTDSATGPEMTREQVIASLESRHGKEVTASVVAMLEKALSRATHPAPVPDDGLREAAVTRVEVIDHRVEGDGRLLVVRNVAVELSYQDDGRTLKVFVTDRAALATEGGR